MAHLRDSGKFLFTMTKNNVFEPSTPGSAAAHAFLLQKTSADCDVAMWAACALMALHSDEPETYQEFAKIWSDKVKATNSKISFEDEARSN